MEIVWSLSRYVLPVITVIILVKCIMTLMLGHPKEKIYGQLIDMSSRTKYPISMWETSVGRSKSCDIVLPYDSVSRSHAVITRRIDGWYVHDLLTRADLKVNGHSVEQKQLIYSGDIIEFSGKRFRFEIVNDPIQNTGKKTKSADGRAKGTQKSSGAKASQQHKISTANKSNQTAAHYSATNKPELRFEKKPAVAPAYRKEKDSFTVETGSRPQPKRTKKEPRLVNKETGEIFLLCGEEVTVGHGRKCDIRFKSAGVEKNHCMLVLCENGWAIEELDGEVYLNRRPLGYSQILFDGDIIGIGEERLRYFQ